MENKVYLAEEDVNRKLLRLELVIGLLATAAFLLLVFTASYAGVSAVWQFVLMAAGFAIFGVGCWYALKLEAESGYYACPNCGHRWVPSVWKAAIAPHIGRNRLLTCPNCGKRGMHRKVLTKE